MNQTHEAVRWLHQEKGIRPDRIAKQLNLNLASVHTILRRFGVKTVSQHQVVSGPRTYPTPVDRDPCTYCGVRGDLGCKHRRAA